MSKPNGYDGFCEECECQTEVFHSSYLGMEVCASCKDKLLKKQHQNTKVKAAGRMSKPNFINHEIVFNPTGNEFDECRGELLGPYQLVKIEEYVYKFIKQPQLTIPQSVAERLDEELGKRTDILDFIYGVGEYGFYSKKLTEWVTNNDEFDEESKRRGNVSAAYLAGKALGVDLVKVVEG